LDPSGQYGLHFYGLCDGRLPVVLLGGMRLFFCVLDGSDKPR
jgi:hypothetical protein